ncbi:hypothetical protein [Legionella hackeliae]|uniref:Uncharacterized protein n=1 Tax=Legionella hackeliae TaxID=449 RepID=A0A0A8UK93_LEGHA|nr:hypothetical protein [Legionella hackeliae]CEK09290.1 protein of unknown function [Legionella hackeliae]
MGLKKAVRGFKGEWKRGFEGEWKRGFEGEWSLALKTVNTL